MIEFFDKDNQINIKSTDITTNIDYDNKNIKIGDFLIDYPGEYEKSGVLVEVKEYEDKLFYSLLIDSKVVLVIFYDEFKLEEEITRFFGDVDILLIVGSQKSNKISDNIEARVVIPFGEQKDIFFTTIGQNKEELVSYKFKGDTDDSNTEYINLKN